MVDSTTRAETVLSPITFEEVATTPLWERLGEAIGNAVAGHLERLELAPGQVLFREGDVGEHLYVVLKGRLCALMSGEGGTTQRLGDIGPGELVGETALLMGTPRSADVEALEPTVLGSLSASAWRHLIEAFPDVEAAVARSAEWRERASEARRFRPDAEWISTWLGQTDLLKGAQATALHALERELMWQTLPGGEVLTREGELGECMWFVVRGRLRVTTQPKVGAPVLIGEVGAGECVGEMALLSLAPRAATVRVVRDTELLRLHKAAFDRLVGAHPESMLRLARAIVGRLQQALGARPAQLKERTVAILASGADIHLPAFAKALATELSSMTPAIVLDGTAAARLAAASADSIPEVVVFVCDPSQTAWTTQCLRQADDLLVVAHADDDPRPGLLEQEALNAAGGREAGCHLVLLQSPGRTPRGSEAWVSARPGVFLHHIREGKVADIARLARMISGKAIGLALSGGGARGFAHIGVLRALDRAGVPIDLVAGTSMGAMIAAVHAQGYEPEAILERCRIWAGEQPWSDYTLPLASIVSGKRMRRALTNLLGDGRIEDLWLPYACMTSNLTRATADAHRKGPLVQLVLASNAVPGLAPPAYYEGDVHVDGGVMDNLPVGILRGMGAGRVIAVDVGTELQIGAPVGLDTCPSGVALAWDRIRRRPRRAPPLFVSLTRAFTLASDERAQEAGRKADLTLRPSLGTYASSDFRHLEPIAELGFRHAETHLAECKDWVPARVIPQA